MKRISFLCLVVGALIVGCSKHDPQDRTQAPPVAVFRKVPATFAPLPGAPAAPATELVIHAIPATEMARAAEALGIPANRVVCASGNYGVLSASWFFGEFSDAFSIHLKELGITFQEDVFVCGQYATTAATWATESAARAVDPLAPAVGWLLVRVDDLKPGTWPLYHALTLYHDGTKLLVLEPQTVNGFAFRTVSLTQEQFSTARLCMF